MLLRVTLAALALSYLVPARLEPQAAPGTAWFVYYTWMPDQDSIAGIAAKDLSSGWDKVLVLTPAVFPPMSHDDSAEVANYIWALGGDLNRDGRPDSVLTGVFSGSEGLGRFLLVLSRDRDGAWTRTFLHTSATGAGFSALALRHDRIYWMGCMSCGDQSRLIPSGKGYRLQYEGD